MIRVLACVFVLFSASGATAFDTVNPLPTDLAVTTNADDGAEVAIARPDHISHIWESAPGIASAFPWTRYTPGGSNVVMGRDGTGRIMIAWLAKGQLMLMTEPFARSSLAGPTVLVGGLKLKALRLGRRVTDGSLILVALTDKGSVIARRQQIANLWEFTGEDDLVGHDLTSISVSSTGDGRFAIVATGKNKQVYWRREAAPHASWIDWSGLGGHDIRTTEVATDANGRLQVVALGGDKLLYSIRQDADGNLTDWGLVSSHPGGTAFHIGTLGSRALTIWGNAPAFTQCSDKVCSAEETFPANPVFTESGPNGFWTDGGTGLPGARFVTTAGEVIDANPSNNIVSVTTTTTSPPVKGDPGCPPSGINPVDGSPCFPGSSGSTTTSTKIVSEHFSVNLIRNGTSSVLTTQIP